VAYFVTTFSSKSTGKNLLLKIGYILNSQHSCKLEQIMALVHPKKAIVLVLLLLATAFPQELAVFSADLDTTYYTISNIQKMETDTDTQTLLVFLKNNPTPDEYQISNDLGVYFFYEYPVSTLPDQPKISPPPMRIRYTKDAITLSLILPTSDKIQATLFNSKGEKQQLLADEIVSAGSWELRIPKETLGRGIYYVRIQSASQSYSIPIAGTRGKK